MSIHILDESICELIAAGEVIERPASVIKELVENSIDAGATSIAVEIKNGGKTYMRVTDNGSGIASDDLPRAFLRHATSKIRTRDDLESILTLGFRGEALASICAVSKVETMSKCPDSENGIRYCIEGGKDTVYEDCGCKDGTTIVVRDLFYNVPARLKFLGKDVTEANSVANVVSRLALSHPEISFRFIRNNKTEILTSGDGKLMSAVYAVLGQQFYAAALPVEYSYNGVNISGCVTKPLLSRANRSQQYFFVNHRSVRAQVFTAALEEAYRNIIMVGKFPGCVLMIDIDPASTDVNAHPTKSEIRFSDPKPIFDAIYFGVKNALMVNDRDVEAQIDDALKKRSTLSDEQILKAPEPKEDFQQFTFGASSAVIKDFVFPQVGSEESVSRQEYLMPDGYDFTQEDQKPKNTVTVKPERSYKYIRPDIQPPKKEEPPAVHEDEKPSMVAVGEVFKTYIVAQCGDDMYLIDKHAAHERLNFNRLKVDEAHVESQLLINPIEVELSFGGHAAVCENLGVFEQFGFGVTAKTAPFISVTSIPMLLDDEDPVDLLTSVADRLAVGDLIGFDSLFDELFHSVACRASVKANSDSAIEELDALAKLVTENDIRYCPHGRPVSVKFTKRELERMFKRIV